MRVMRSGRAIAVLIFLCIVALLLGFRGMVAATLVPRVLGAATGTSVAFSQIRLHASSAEFTGVKVSSRHGQQIAYIPRVELSYDFRDLLPGSDHRFGLHSIVVYDPQIWVVHNRDGSYNIPTQAKNAASPRAASPLNFSARIVHGRLTVDDYTRIYAGSQHLYVDDVNLDAIVNTANVTRYTASLAYREGSHRYPIYGRGTIDARSDINLQHWTAEKVPLPRIVNYGTNNADLRMTGGALQNVDAWYYGKLAATANARGVKVTMSQLRTPIRNGQGVLDVGNDGATTNGFTAELNGIPVNVRGGISDLSNPQLRFSITGRGDISRITKAAVQTARLPIRGPVDFAMLAEGTPKDPLVLISLRSPRIDYQGIRLASPNALVSFDGREADVLKARLGYRSLALSARGRVSLQSGPNAVEMVAGLSGPSDGVPFASGVVHNMQLRGSVLALARDMKKIDTLGVLRGDAPHEQLAGVFHVNSQGVGNIDPLAIDAGSRSLFGRIAIDHPHQQLSALLRANNFPVAMRGARATISGNIYAEQRGNELGMLGSAGLREARYGKVAIDDAIARFGGGVGDVRISTLEANGTFGTLHASGTISGANHVALEGRYAGSLAALSHIAGNLPASGSVDAPIALVYDGGRAIAQIHDAHFSNARIRGVPIGAVSATIGTQGKNVRIYAARAQVANSGRATVTGSLDRGMAFSIANLDVRALRGVGLPLQAGVASVAATMHGPLTAPAVNGSVLLESGLYDRYPIDAQAAIAYSGNTLRLQDGLVGLGPALVTVDGNVSRVRMGAPIRPIYDLNASMRAADAHALVEIAQPKLAEQHVQGSIDAAVHVGGSGSAPSLIGQITVPEGSVHGLAFRDAHATLNGTPQNFNVGSGRVVLGTTALSFGASAAGGALRASLDAPSTNLADFNDYFDAGDSLAGAGSLAVDVVADRGLLSTSGNVNLQGLRYHRFDVGDAYAGWKTTGRTIAMNANVVGTAGTARLSGTVRVPVFSSVAEIATHADTNLNAKLSNLDLATWMPMLGYTAPVTGQLNAAATVRGQFPDETIAAQADIAHGTVGRIALLRAHVALTSMHGRGTIQEAAVEIPNLNANASGTFGLHAGDPLNLTMRATSQDVGALLQAVSGKQQSVAGALDTTLRIQGTRDNPALNDSVALTSLRYDTLSIPKVSAIVTATRSQITLRDGLVQLQRGRITAAGSVPITTAPNFALDPSNKAVRLALAADNVDFSNFESALPKGTHLAGTMAGTLTVGGTIDDPQLGGKIAVHDGYFVGPVDQNPISKINGSIAFAGTTVALQAMHANVGGGTMDVDGSAHVPNVRDFRAASFNATLVAKGAQFNSPQYFRGKVSANVAASRVRGGIPQIAGSLEIPSARIPLSAFWNPGAAKGPQKALPDVGLNIAAKVGNDVRVQSSNVDVGAQGAVNVAGTLNAPTLNGRFESTGGTVSFFRTFTIEDAHVRFDPSNGIMPFVNATATTNVNATDVALNVSGLAPDNMHVAFTSDPQYSQQQIMGLLAGVGGPSGPAVAGAGNFSANSAVQTLATSQINTFFTREMLEPLSAQLGSALGLQNLQLTDDFNSGFGLSAAKAFGKHMTAVYSQSMGQSPRQSLSLEAHHGESTAFDLLFYQVTSPTLLAFSQGSSMMGFDNGAGVAMNIPYLGTNGTSLLYEHKF